MGASTTPPRPNALVQFYRYVLGIGHERNVGGAERTVRYFGGALFLAAAAGILVAPVLSGSVNRFIAALLAVSGVYVIYEARVQYCPLNHTIGRSTFREE